MTSGPIRVLGLTKGDTGDGVIELWRSIIGPFEPEQAKAEKPESIRAMFGSRFIKFFDIFFIIFQWHFECCSRQFFV